MILLLGATGYMGQAFADELRRRGTLFIPLTRKAINYTQFEVLFDYVRKIKPAFLINCAGYTGRPDVEACDVQRVETVQANTILPQIVARVCNMTNTPWGHVSSCSIYCGSKLLENGGMRIVRELNRPEIQHLFDNRPERFCGFTELDEPNFSFRQSSCSFYSGTKALAEDSLRGFGNHYLWRPGLVFDHVDTPRNFLSRIQRHPRLHDSINSLSHRGDFVKACLDLWERSAQFGAYNVVNPGAVSTRHLAATVERILKPDIPLAFASTDVEFDRPAEKASHPGCIVDGAKLRAARGAMRPVAEALEDSLEKWQSMTQLADGMALSHGHGGLVCVK